MILDEVEKEPVRQTRHFELAGNTFVYPLLLKRYKALFIDGFGLLMIMVGIMVAMDDYVYRTEIMISVGVLFGFVYEPFLTSHSGTIGQRLMGIRVRSFDDPTKAISLGHAYVRHIVKYVLGWVSFVTIHFNEQHRALHDLAGSSVMIEVK